MKNLKQKMASFLIVAMMVITNTTVPVYARGLDKEEIELIFFKVKYEKKPIFLLAL